MLEPDLNDERDVAMPVAVGEVASHATPIAESCRGGPQARCLWAAA